MKTATLADLVTSAQAAANKAFAMPDRIAVLSTMLEEFAVSGFERSDVETWENAFNAQFEMLTNFSRQPSPATLAAQKAAQAAAAAQATVPAPK